MAEESDLLISATVGEADAALRATGKGFAELRAREGGGAAMERKGELPKIHFEERAVGLVRAFNAVKALLRVLAITVYLFPALLIAKLVLWLLDSWYGDLVTVAFVLLLLVFFTVLALAVLLFAFAGPRSQRRGRVRLAPADGSALQRAAEAAGETLPEATTADELARLAEGDAGRPLRVRGRVEAGEDLAAGEDVLEERWFQGPKGETVARLAVGRSFALLAEGRPPVVVELDEVPWLLGSWEEQSPPRGRVELEPFERWVRDRGAEALSLQQRCSTLALHQGDEVELVAFDCRAIPDSSEIVVNGRRLRLGAAKASAPYRGARGEPALLATSTVLISKS